MLSYLGRYLGGRIFVFTVFASKGEGGQGHS